MNNVFGTNATLRKVGTILILWVLCFVLFWSFACWAILDGDYFLTSQTFTNPPRWKPAVSDIVGKWQLSEASTKKIEDAGTKMPAHEIQFYADGTFKAINYPILQGWSENQIKLGFYTGTGTWRFDKMRFKPWSIALYYDNHPEGVITLPGYYFLQGKEPPFKMYDAMIMVFEKQ